MDTKIIKITEESLDRAAREAADVWRRGGLVAFPTETVYGLGGNGLDACASRRIYAAKGRPSDNPLILHIADRSQLEPLVQEIDEKAEALMKAFWPGPLTLVFRRSALVPPETSGGLDTVAVRMPSHPVAARLLAQAGLPIAAPSANLSGRPSPTSVSHVIQDMNGRIDLIIDGGDSGIGLESTIVDLTDRVPTLLRPGYITVPMLEQVVGRLEADPVVFKKADKDLKPKAPGMKYRHYAPKAQMLLVEGEPTAVVSYINAELMKLGAVREGFPDQSRPGGAKVGILASDETADAYAAGFVRSAGSRSDLASVGHNLFRVLREFDDLDVDFIYAETFPAEGEGLAVMNRLNKSAGHRLVRV